MHVVRARRGLSPRPSSGALPWTGADHPDRTRGGGRIAFANLREPPGERHSGELVRTRRSSRLAIYTQRGAAWSSCHAGCPNLLLWSSLPASVAPPQPRLTVAGSGWNQTARRPFVPGASSVSWMACLSHLSQQTEAYNNFQYVTPKRTYDSHAVMAGAIADAGANGT